MQRDRASVREDEREAERHLEHRERRDERRQIQLDDRQRVDPAGAAPTATADEQRDGDQREAGQMQRVCDERGDDAGQRDERSDREIDAAGDDDERLADAKHAVVRDLAQHAHDVGRLEKRAVRSDVDDDDRGPPVRARAAPPMRSQYDAALASSRRRSRCGRDDAIRRRRRRARTPPTIAPPRITRMRCDIPSTSGSSLDTMTMAAPLAARSSMSA